MRSVDASLPVETIVSGKFRRYHNIPVWKQLLQFRTIVLPNIIDTAKIVVGTLQSLLKLILWRPDVIFTKGGYVCLPVGVAARILGIPLVIHDSDTHAGLTNTILAKWAVAIATGAPLEYYDYPASRAHYTGVPLDPALRPVSEAKQHEAKSKLGIAADRPFVVITGGGLGAKVINDAVVASSSNITEHADILLLTGKSHFEEVSKAIGDERPTALRLEPFLAVQDLYVAFTAADVVVGRAGATTLLEVAALAKPTILIPNAQLTGGHQLTNAARYEEKGAVVVLDDATVEENPSVLVQTIDAILRSPEQKDHLSQAIRQFARPDAAHEVAALILASKRA